jgi:hypothetical protein
VKFYDLEGQRIELSKERWQHIVDQHPEVERHRGLIADVLREPDLIKRSRRAQDIWLYYKFYSTIFSGKYLMVVVKKSLHSFVLTCYITDTIKRGEMIWQKK